ncbi:hypothetical protein [Mycolicibacterium phlei]|jgi:hypothetical protein
MWVVEINIAGHQFTHRVRDRRIRRPLRLGARAFGWRPASLRRPA